ARPALLAEHREDPGRARLLARRHVRRGHRGHRHLVPRKPRLVGAAQGTGSARVMTRWLVTGAGGMLGHELLRVLAGESVTALERTELDITDVSAVRDAIAGHDVV